jgi:hypothetical protein
MVRVSINLLRLWCVGTTGPDALKAECEYSGTVPGPGCVSGGVALYVLLDFIENILASYIYVEYHNMALAAGTEEMGRVTLCFIKSKSFRPGVASSSPPYISHNTNSSPMGFPQTPVSTDHFPFGLRSTVMVIPGNPLPGYVVSVRLITKPGIGTTYM